MGVYPGVHSSGYVSNVEGVLNRFKDAINITKNQLMSDELSELKKCNFLIDSLNNTINGSNKEILTLIFSDPMGHSKILHDKAIFRELTPDEIENLS